MRGIWTKKSSTGEKIHNILNHLNPTVSQMMTPIVTNNTECLVSSYIHDCVSI